MIQRDTDRIEYSPMGMLAVIALAALGGCGKQQSTLPAPQTAITPQQVTVTPATAQIAAGSTYQFSTTVVPSNALNAVHWSVSGTGCSGAACGSVDGAGNYSAPNSPPNPSTVTITATSILDQTKLGEATVTVVTPPPPPPTTSSN